MMLQEAKRRERGYLDGIPTNRVTAYEAEMLHWIRAEHGDLLKAIRDAKDLSNESAASLKDALATFGKTFA